MNLPGRLRSTTLGDVLGRLHRAGVSGILELVEPSGARAGRAHRIFLREGRVDDVHTDLKAQSLRSEVSSPLRHKLDLLFRFSEALIRFHVRGPRPSVGPLLPPLGPEEFLHGRPRARAQREAEPEREVSASRRDLMLARRMLGLPPGADATAARAAFRRLATEAHPDRFPLASQEERTRLLRRFAELSAAYHLLAG